MSDYILVVTRSIKMYHPSYDLTILRFQFCTSLSSQQADHKAVAVIGVAAGLCGGGGGDRRGDQRSADGR